MFPVSQCCIFVKLGRNSGSRSFSFTWGRTKYLRQVCPRTGHAVKINIQHKETLGLERGNFVPPAVPGLHTIFPNHLCISEGDVPSVPPELREPPSKEDNCVWSTS